jgi:hypothetical protein
MDQTIVMFGRLNSGPVDAKIGKVSIRGGWLRAIAPPGDQLKLGSKISLCTLYKFELHFLS